MSPKPTSTQPTSTPKNAGRSVSLVIDDPQDVAAIESLTEEGFRTFQQEVRRIFTIALRREMRDRSTPTSTQ